MAKNSNANSKSVSTEAKETLALAKLMLNKFHALHEFHIVQLKAYPIACTPISLAGSVEVDTSTHSVLFTVQTMRSYVMRDGKAVPRRKYSPIGKLLVPKKKYLENKRLAKELLSVWTRELLWKDTKITVIFDVPLSNEDVME